MCMYFGEDVHLGMNEYNIYLPYKFLQNQYQNWLKKKKKTQSNCLIIYRAFYALFGVHCHCMDKSRLIFHKC